MSALVDIVEAIDQEILDDTEKDIGYRSMHQRLIVKYGFTANRDFVRRIELFRPNRSTGAPMQTASQKKV